MKTGLLDLLKKAFHGNGQLHPIDQRMARHYIKSRLAVHYPELRNDPKALEEAYRSLDLEPQTSTEEGEPPSSFNIRLP